LKEECGINNLPNQIMAKAISDGFVFNILCVGETACGKSSLLDSLFNTRLDSTPSTHDIPRVFLRKNTYDLFEREIRLKLTVVETAGFGDQINKDDSFKVIGDFIDSQFQSYLDEELKIKRNLSNYHDTRIHVCLYFINPTGHSLKALDLVTMKHLDSKVNIIPIIAKSDTISKGELQRFKQNILNELNTAGVKIYRFPTDDETLAEENLKANVKLQFSLLNLIYFILRIFFHWLLLEVTKQLKLEINMYELDNIHGVLFKVSSEKLQTVNSSVRVALDY
jgi:septin 6/8/11